MEAPAIEEIKCQVTSLGWYHTIDLGHGILTPGAYDHRPYLPFYGLPPDLANKTALDIGAASGFFSFEMETRGARVTAIDLPAWMDHDFGPLYQPDLTADEGRRYLYEPFEFAKSVRGSQVEKRALNVYDLSPETIGTFDLVFCSSVLLHLTDPIKALWRIQSVTKGVAIIATGIHPLSSQEPMAFFAGHRRGDVWWLPSRAGLEAMVQSAGFAGWEWVGEFRLDYRDGRPGLWHGVIRAWNSLEGFDLPTVPPATHAMESPPGGTPEEWRQQLAAQEAELARLRALVAGYERGRFTWLMRWLHRVKAALLGRLT